METIWFFVVFCFFCLTDVSLGTKINCSLEKCTITEITKKGTNQEIDLPIPLDNTEGITFVELDDNFLDSIPSNIFTAFPKLTRLRIESQQNVINVDALSEAKDLEILNINSIFKQDAVMGFDTHSVDLHVFKQLSKLKSLSIQANLKTIPRETFPSVNSLRYIYFINCNITNIEDFAFSGAIQVEIIKLRYNSITELRQNTFAGLPNLRSLILSNNQISRIEDGALDLPNLQIIRLNGNQLKTLSDNVFSQLPELKVVDLIENKLEHIGRSLYSLQKVIRIELENNTIQDIDLKEFAKLSTLKELKLSNSGFDWSTQEYVSDDIVASINSNLDTLHIANSNLTDSRHINSLKVFKKLKNLYLEENPFEEISWEASSIRETFPELEIIYLSELIENCENMRSVYRAFWEKHIQFLFYEKNTYRSYVGASVHRSGGCSL